MKPKIIFIFVGLPRKIKEGLNFIQFLIDEYKAQVIFSTNEEILKYKLPDGSKVIINENNSWYQNKLKEIFYKSNLKYNITVPPISWNDKVIIDICNKFDFLLNVLSNHIYN